MTARNNRKLCQRKI